MKNLIIPILAVLARFQSCSPANQKLAVDETATTIPPAFVGWFPTPHQ